ncbi:hypothetical protein ES703_04100 [subsurface metagenome]
MTKKERGISFTAWSIPKIMDRTKTMTRRTYGLEFVNQDPDAFELLRMEGDMAVFKQIRFSMTQIEPRIPCNSFPKKIEGGTILGSKPDNVLFCIKCPYGQVGDRLWVQETWYSDCEIIGDRILYKADGLKACFNYGGPWKSPRFMPRWASRIDLEITEVRAERIKEISRGDVVAEGLPRDEFSYAQRFMNLWDSLDPRYPWEANNWVWPIGFRKVK